MKTMIQVRIDEDLKAQATMVYEQLGLDLSTAIRMFLKKSVAVNGIPFETRNESPQERALASLQAHSKSLGNSDLTEEEIEEIISKARAEKTR